MTFSFCPQEKCAFQTLKLVNSTVGIPVDPQTRCFAGVVRVLAIQKGSQTSRQLLALCHLGTVPYVPHHPALETTHGSGKDGSKNCKIAWLWFTIHDASVYICLFYVIG